MARAGSNHQLIFPGSGIVRWGLLLTYLFTFFSFALIGAGYLISLAQGASPTARALYVAAACVVVYVALWLVPRVYRMGSYRVDARHLIFYQPHRIYRIEWDTVLSVEIGSDLRIRADDHHKSSLEVPVLIIETAGKIYRFPFMATTPRGALARLVKHAAGAARPAEAVREHLEQHGRPRSAIPRLIAVGWKLVWLVGTAVAVAFAALGAKTQ